MARITALPTPAPDSSVEELHSFDPEIATKMEKLLALQTYTCHLNPITTKKMSLEGALKFPLKVATILTLPVLAVGAGAGVVALSPLNTIINLFCQGCSKPGGTLPRFFAIGDIGQLNLKKGSRRQTWRKTKTFIKNYVNWGGVIKMDTDKYLSKHGLDQYHPGWEKLDSAAQEEVIEKFLNTHSPVDQNSAGIGEGVTPTVACSDSSLNKDRVNGIDSKKKASKSAGGTNQ
jgi:hypothetical protein